MSLLPKFMLEQVFNRAAGTYDSAALIFREIGDRLVERLDFVRLMPNTVLDLGCGTGYITKLLSKKYLAAELISLDFSLAMLQQLQHKKMPVYPVCAVAEHLPFMDEVVDLVVSNAMLPWCESPELIFAEVYRVLKPGGLFLFSTLGPDTLYELRNSSMQIDNTSRVHSFIDMHEVGDALLQANFTDPVMDMEFLSLRYDKSQALFTDLKATGSSNMQLARWENLSGKQRIRQFMAAYEQFRGADQKLPATLELIYGHAWKSGDDEMPGTIIPVTDIMRRGAFFTE